MSRNDEMFSAGGRIAKTAFVAKSAELSEPVDIADHVTVYGGTSVGKYTYINVYSVIYSMAQIGKFCSIGRSVEIGLASHPVDFLSTHPFQLADSLFHRNADYLNVKKVKWNFHKETKIGNDVWIGAKASISSGVTIGDGAIIAAGAVVSKDVEPYSIVGGVPAKLIRKRFSDETIKELLLLKWWDRPLSDLSHLPFDDIEECIRQLKKL